MTMFRIAAAAMLALLLSAAARPPSPEARTATLFDRLAGDAAARRLFLQAMPKGGDLHNHLGGSTYAEDFLATADELDLCVAADGGAILPPPCDGTRALPARGLARRDQALYDRLVDALSMRGVDPRVGAAVTGHDRFFATFERFGAAGLRSYGAMIATAQESAARDHTLYLELMILPPAVRPLLAAAGPAAPTAETDLPALAARLAPVIGPAVAQAGRELDAAEAEAATRNRCATPTPAPACGVAVRYQVSGLRNLPPAAVFAQLAFGFALADADPRVVGVNLVAPEDGAVARTDYALHMAMVRWLGVRHPNVGISLHAGELALGLVPPRDMADHIAQAVQAGARRIGHGVDIAHEADAATLLARMARERIAVEINLTSNDVILGVTGARHPLNLYRRAGVPVVLATDDAGVSRIDLTNEYLRAATEHGLDYRALKMISRASLHYSFLPGASLWRDADRFLPVAACPLGAAPGADCRRLLAASPRAALEWRLEEALARFEAGAAALAATLGR